MDAVSGENEQPPSQADILIEIANSAELFHTPDMTGYADIDVDGHRETWPIRSRGFKSWLTRQFFEATEDAPNSEAMTTALNKIEASAHFDASERAVYIRVGEHDGKVYLDLCDQTWRAVEIDTAGWRVVESPPVRFRRTSGMLQLPLPLKGGSINELRPFLNISSDADFVLTVSWILAGLNPSGPFPVLGLAGEQGTAKSFLSRVLRGIVDPNTAPLRALPREDRDLFIAATNTYILVFDNVSTLSFWISDTLCRLATGGGFSTRQRHTDQDEILFDASRPIILNGIEDFITRPDLADRSLLLTLLPISKKKRKFERKLKVEFAAAHPRILGVLLGAVSTGLKNLPTTELSEVPRMADFALWISACEPALWEEGTFWKAYKGNLDTAIHNIIEADPVAVAVRKLMDEKSEWSGTATQLLDDLSDEIGERVAKSKEWPTSPRALSGRLRRSATFLRKAGLEISSSRDNLGRKITITHISPDAESEDTGSFASPSSQSSQPNEANGLDRDANQNICVAEPAICVTSGDGDATVTQKNSVASPSNQLKTKGDDASDGHDAKLGAGTNHEKKRNFEPPGTVASAPLMITVAMRAGLHDLGLTDDEIRNLTPLEAWKRLQAAGMGPRAASPNPHPSLSIEDIIAITEGTSKP
jgi:hypothetical protein